MVPKFALVQKSLTHWMKKNISQYMITFFYENDTNEVKSSYHDDCSEKKQKKIFCILNWAMAVSCSRNMNFVNCRVSETSEEKFFNIC